MKAESNILNFNEIDSNGDIYLPGCVTIKPDLAFKILDHYVDENGIKVITEIEPLYVSLPHSLRFYV